MFGVSFEVVMLALYIGVMGREWCAINEKAIVVMILFAIVRLAVCKVTGRRFINLKKVV